MTHWLSVTPLVAVSRCPASAGVIMSSSHLLEASSSYCASLTAWSQSWSACGPGSMCQQRVDNWGIVKLWVKLNYLSSAVHISGKRRSHFTVPSLLPSTPCHLRPQIFLFFPPHEAASMAGSSVLHAANPVLSMYYNLNQFNFHLKLFHLLQNSVWSSNNEEILISVLLILNISSYP